MVYKHQNNKKLTLNSQLQTYQILTTDDQMTILCLSYFITTVTSSVPDKPDIVMLHLSHAFNEAPGQIQRACLPEGPKLSFPFLLSVIIRILF